MYSINENVLYTLGVYSIKSNNKLGLRLFYTSAADVDFATLVKYIPKYGLFRMFGNTKNPIKYIDYFGDCSLKATLPLVDFKVYSKYIEGNTTRSLGKVQTLLKAYNPTLNIKPSSLGGDAIWDSGVLTFKGITYRYNPVLTRDLNFDFVDNRYLVSEKKEKVFLLPNTARRHIAAEIQEKVVLDESSGILSIRYKNIHNNVYVDGFYQWSPSEGKFTVESYQEMEIAGYKGA